MNTQHTEQQQKPRTSALFVYKDSNDEDAFISHAELLTLRTRYIKAHPRSREDVYDDESLFDAKVESELRQQMIDWSNDV